MLEARGLSVSYGAVSAVRGVDLTVAAGEIVALVGANGAGKSSTLKAIMGLVPARVDALALDGRSLAGLSTRQRIEAGLALSPEGRHVFVDMTVRENLEVGDAVGRPTPRPERIDRIFALFPRLAERRDQRAGTLSGGEQQMLAIGRALMSEPRALLLDEPTLGLAPKLVDQVLALGRTLADGGLAVLLAEQNAVATLEVADRAYVLETGAVATSGPAPVLAGDPAIRRTYLGL